MKLRNKKTGEIKPAEAREDGIYLYNEITEQWYKYELKLLAKEWEYYEEPKEFWYICDFRVVRGIEGSFTREEIARMKSIGNYFETEEEAEKAVEKLKAWKRLKDKGFRFNAWYGGSKCIDFEINSLENETYIPRQICDDLDLLFGGEE